MPKKMRPAGIVALIVLLFTACTSPPNLEGTWRLHSTGNASTRLLRFVGDSVFYLNPHQLESTGGPVRFSKDSIVLFNPWDTELHFQMQRVHDTIHMENGMYLTKIEIAVANDISGKFGVTLPFSREEKSTIQDSKCLAVFLAPYRSQGLRPDTLFHGYALGVNDQWVNPEELLSAAATELLIDGKRSVLIYSDASVPDSVLQILASRLQSATGGRASLYRGYFYPQSKYYLTFDPMK